MVTKVSVIFLITHCSTKEYEDEKCTRCSNTKIWELATGQMACSKCHSLWFPPKSYWPVSRLSVQQKARLSEYFCLGVPAYRLRFLMNVSREAAQRLYKLLRICVYQNNRELLSPQSGTFEMDETMFGGHRPGYRGWGAAVKTIVYGIYKRNGQVITFPVSSRSRAQILPLITKHTLAGSL